MISINDFKLLYYEYIILGAKEVILNQTKIFNLLKN